MSCVRVHVRFFLQNLHVARNHPIALLHSQENPRTNIGELNTGVVAAGLSTEQSSGALARGVKPRNIV